MELYYAIVLFVFGTIFGSFYNVVGDRVADGKSIIYPPSHCPKCKHRLTPLELVPIFSYLFQGGKCKNCKCKIPLFHPLYEIFVGLLFMFSYISFGFTGDFVIALTFVSMLAIIIVSDYYYMIIPDEILIFFGVTLALEVLLINGIDAFGISLLSGIISFGVMFLIKLFGDFIFKTESMGGGDIKLLFFLGFILGWPQALLSIFLGSIIGLPISLIVLKIKNTNIIPFGPFLALGAIIILLTQFNIEILLNALTM
ncbi:MAG: prepilin peptidase [Bacilli bacterium]|nr:prepilin peptidase [Bacilli bacterium]